MTLIEAWRCSEDGNPIMDDPEFYPLKEVDIDLSVLDKEGNFSIGGQTYQIHREISYS